MNRIVRASAVVVLLAAFSFGPGAPICRSQSRTLDRSLWVTDGAVNAVALAGNTIYAAGDFAYAGPCTGNGAALNLATGRALPASENVNGEITACTSDGKGGWFIAGQFDKVGTRDRKGLAHILADGSLDLAFRPAIAPEDIQNFIEFRALAAYGSSLYVGGAFASIGGQPRNCLAAFNAATGALLPWNPGLTYPTDPDRATAYVLTLEGSAIYVGGEFATCAGQSRHGFAAFNAATGVVLPLDVHSDGVIKDIKISGATIYACGYFSSIGGQSRYNVAALNLTTGLAKAWNPNPASPADSPRYGDAGVEHLAVSGSTVYVSGRFASIGGAARLGIAALDTVAGTARDWNPVDPTPPSHWIYGLSLIGVFGSTVYVQGRVYEPATLGYNGVDFSYPYLVDGSSGMLFQWDATPPGLNTYIAAMAQSGSSVYAGGHMTSIGGVRRRSLAAFDQRSGMATQWNPSPDDAVASLAVSGSTVYAGGAFSHIGGQAHSHLAALDGSTGAALDWSPNPDQPATVLAIAGKTLYVGGAFTSMAGQPRRSLAAFNLQSKELADWNPDPDGPVSLMATLTSSIYVCGTFTTIGGQNRHRLAAIDAATGAATSWAAPDIANGTVINALAVSPSAVYIGGDFSSLGGQAGRSLAAFDIASGALTDWSPNVSAAFRYSPVAALATSGSIVYAGGGVTSFYSHPITFTSYYSLAAFDGNSAELLPWIPLSISTTWLRPIQCIAVSGGTVVVGGGFDSISDAEDAFPPDLPLGPWAILQNRPNLAQFGEFSLNAASEWGQYR